jgi:PKD repeat protein
MPLLAPSGTVITLIPSSTVMSVNGSVEITGTVIEQGTTSSGTGTQQTSTPGAGTPVHNGTVVTFTSTIGSVDPKEARTHNGAVTVRLVGDGRSGTAKVTAFSGGASGTTEISVGTAAVDHIVLTASPQTLPSSGGTAQLAARVEDASGNPLASVPVNFSADAGTISASPVVTDDQGTARSSITTPKDVVVTATAGTKTATANITLAARTGIAITPPSTPITAGSPAAFSVSVSGTANVRDVTVTWDDGTSTSLGAISGSTTVQHVFHSAGNYTVSATATDAAGNRETVSTTVTVQPAVPVSVTLTASSTSPATGQTVTFTATTGTLPAGVIITRYDWTFGDGGATTTTANTATHVYTAIGAKDITVNVVLSNGSTAIGQTTITVTNPPPVSVVLSASPASVLVGAIVTFTAQPSALPAGVTIVRYDWAFGDGLVGSTTGNTTTHAYATAGIKNATVTVVLSNGTNAIGQVVVTVS